jgi:capsular polysaccharide export protein
MGLSSTEQPPEGEWLALGVPRALGVVAVFRRKISKIQGIAAALGASELLLCPGDSEAARVQAVVGWGQRPTIRRAQAYAVRHGLPFWRLEDGFLRSVRAADDRPLSLVLDDRGIYYDARHPSLLESWLNAPQSNDPLVNPGLLARAQRCVDFVIENELSKYNNSHLDLPRWLRDETRELVLVVDQTRGDQSIERGLANAATFEQMLQAALDDHPSALVVVKTHPDVRFRGKRGHFSESSLSRHPGRSRLRVLSEPVNPVALLRLVKHVYVCTSQLGFEGLLLGKPVTCFGAGFYSGWGLTQDRHPVSRRTRRRSALELAAAALLMYPRYLHPVRREPCPAEVVLEHLALQRSRFKENHGTSYCFGFTPWKRGFVRDYLKAPGNEVQFAPSVERLERSDVVSRGRLVAWGRRLPKELDRFATERGLPVWTMEDGFLRSVGLGSDFTLPASLVLDERGIYYDPTGPSDLEHLLEYAVFNQAELDRARALRERLVHEGLTKYSLGDQSSVMLNNSGRRVLLVPGQVEDDASIRLGAADGCRTNAQLLAAARVEAKDAYIVYKPHPEVLSGNRHSEPVSAEAYDQMVVDAPLGACLALADEVHTMTSLVGFEALLRDIPVVVHGRPFYAGWGLTKDRQRCERRTRRLTLDELVAGVLLRYPRYYSYSAAAFVTAEDAVTELLAQRAATIALPARASRYLRQKNKLENLLRDVLHAL